MKIFHLFSVVVVLLLAGCNGNSIPTSLRLTDLPTGQLRNMQMRQFDQSDINRVNQAVIKTLVNLDFQIVRVDDLSHLIEVIRLENGHIMQANIMLISMVNHGTTVRIALRYNQYPVTSPQVYQEFFDTLSRNLS
ncbi:hypothetical protein H3S71_03105 [Commensalibacter sp. W8133]|uniref:hypothetical protein n=1 Tax=Commensalibacter sp. W8133 TaxID=2750953 RepID=UPI0018DDD03A|nr:hypothetical protein [Commensalibacter sp. W8133]MBI0018323.1 hypothetical protein [Commensalibacter sp. W8133]